MLEDVALGVALFPEVFLDFSPRLAFAASRLWKNQEEPLRPGYLGVKLKQFKAWVRNVKYKYGCAAIPS